jgi:uncharacterized MAPEG superfamily protein
MKTIEIQKHKKIKDTIDVFFNGKKHLMRHQSLKIHVDDDNSFEIRVYQLFAASPLYTFEPNDNMLLQILVNWRILFWYIIMMLSAVILIFVVEYIYGIGTLRSIVPWISIIGLFLLFLFRKKLFIIREVSIENNVKQ